MPDTTAADTTTSSAGRPALTPYLAVSGAAAAMDWYRDVLGAIETVRFVGDDGRVGHGEMVIGGSPIMLADPYPEMSLYGPDHYDGTTVTLHLDVVDVDHSYRQAVEASAQTEREPADQRHGNRTAVIVDPFGHRWMLSQAIEDPSTSTNDGDAAPESAPNGFSQTGRRPAEPGYVVMVTADLDRARSFFGKLFGWEIEAGNVKGGGHVANTRFPMGFMTGDTDQFSTPTTVVHFRVDDIDVYADRIIELDGQVLSRADYSSGGNAACLDDQGYRFDLFRPAPGF